MLKILMLSSECVPFAKTGGIADVVGSLPIALAKLGMDVRVAMPHYSSIDSRAFALQPVLPGFPVPMGGHCGCRPRFAPQVWLGDLLDSGALPSKVPT